MDELSIRSAVEGILFAAGDPVPSERIAAVLGVEMQTVLDAAEELSNLYSFERRGIRLVRMENNLQLCSAPEHATYITRVMETRKPPKLSPSALEVIAIVAYFQPVTRAYIDQIRGVDSSYTVGVLIERGLIEPCGKLDVVGRPTIYKTSDIFLRTMGIKSIEELPGLPDLASDDGISQLQSKIDELSVQEDEQMVIPETTQTDDIQPVDNEG